jgi:hypothetical protein
MIGKFGNVKQRKRGVGISDLISLLSAQVLKDISICSVIKAFSVSLFAGFHLIRVSRRQSLRTKVPSISEWLVDTKQCVLACHKHLKGCQYGTRLSMYAGSGGIVWWYISTYTFKCGGARSRVGSHENWLRRHSSGGNYT